MKDKPGGQSDYLGDQKGDDPQSLSAVERYKRATELRKFGPPMTLDPAPALNVDTMWRGLARDGEMRLLIARCTAAVRDNCSRLACGPEAARLIGETLIASLLLRSTLNPSEQLQFIARNEGPAGRIVADVWADGGMRATVERRDLPVGLNGLGDGNLEVARTRGGRQVYRSSIPLQSTVADTVMHYLVTSEQIVSLLRIEQVVEDGKLRFAGGYLVQMMPEGSHEDLATLVTNIESLPPLHQGMTEADSDARSWTTSLLSGFLWDQVGRESVVFRCRCSNDRVLAMLSALPRSDIEELLRDREAVETVCEYCAAKYVISPEQLKSLLADPS